MDNLESIWALQAACKLINEALDDVSAGLSRLPQDIDLDAHLIARSQLQVAADAVRIARFALGALADLAAFGDAAEDAAGEVAP